MMNTKELIDKIVDTEWHLFSQVQSIDERPECQDDKEGFTIMRASQFEAWDYHSLVSYLTDLNTAISENRNLLAEKYAYMMEFTDPDEYEKIKNQLPKISAEKEIMVQRILQINLVQTIEFFSRYPKFSSTCCRPLYKKDDGIDTSIETYTIGELRTYSYQTLRSLYRHIIALNKNSVSYVNNIFQNTARYYGFSNMDEVERSILI